MSISIGGSDWDRRSDRSHLADGGQPGEHVERCDRRASLPRIAWETGVRNTTATVRGTLGGRTVRLTMPAP